MTSQAHALTLPPRPCDARPLVSTVTPCFNHGRFLEESLASIAEQSYPSIETIVVDDGSTDAQTTALMDQLEREAKFTVERLERNRGPAVARNTGVRRAQGRYILPVDADNRLLPNAIDDLVAQLQAAPRRVGFVYPNLQFFGNRHDYFEAPEYNLFELLHGNYCDTSSLLDRNIFEAGLYYPEGVFREDWHFVLTLAKHGIVGERARGKTLLFRKRGFNRSDLVGHAGVGTELNQASRRPHPEFFGSYGAYARVKAEWSPALSIIVLAPVSEEEKATLRRRLEQQTAIDAEVLIRGESWDESSRGPLVRSYSSDQSSGNEAFLRGLSEKRGEYVLASATAGLEILDDRAFIEKLLRGFSSDPQLGAVGFVNAGDEGRYPWQPLEAGRVTQEGPHSVAWSLDRLRKLDKGVPPESGDLLAGVLAHLSQVTGAQRRHVPIKAAPLAPIGNSTGLSLSSLTAAVARHERASRAPLLPGSFGARDRRQSSEVWLPPQTRVLFRHRHIESGQRAILTSPAPPQGFVIEHGLGTVKVRPLPGTQRLESSGGGASLYIGYRVRPEEEPPESGQRTLGYVETFALPMLVPLKLARDPLTGQLTLTTGPSDPISRGVDVLSHLGFIEPSPLHPLRPPHIVLPPPREAFQPAVVWGRTKWMLEPLHTPGPMSRGARFELVLRRAALLTRAVIRRISR